MLNYKKLGKKYANVEAGVKLQPLTAVEIELFICLSDKISLVLNRHREDQRMPVIMEIPATSGKTSMLSNT